MEKMFADLRVVELSSVLAGPSAGAFFAELGAKVLKIENPRTGGDITRQWKLPREPSEQKFSAYYWCVNAGKDVLFLDLTQADDYRKFENCLGDADILICNFKHGDAKKLKTDFDSIKYNYPRLIYANINGFSEENDRVAYDLILQAESGMMYLNAAPNQPPLKLPIAFIDLLAGHQLKEALLIALLKRSMSGKGMRIDVSLFDSALASLANQGTNWLIAHTLPQALGSLHPNIAPYGEQFMTKDGHLITFAIGSDDQFAKLSTVLGSAEWAKLDEFRHNQDRVRNRLKLSEKMAFEISKLEFQTLFDACLRTNVPIGKIRNIQEVFETEAAKKMIQPFYNEGKELLSLKTIAFQIHES